MAYFWKIRLILRFRFRF